MLLMISDNSLCPLLCASVSKVFSVTEAAAGVASGHKYKGTSSRNTNTKKLAQEIQIQRKLLKKYKYKYKSILLQIQKYRIIKKKV